MVDERGLGVELLVGVAERVGAWMVDKGLGAGLCMGLDGTRGTYRRTDIAMTSSHGHDLITRP